MRGSGSPTSMSTIRVPPSVVPIGNCAASSWVGTLSGYWAIFHLPAPISADARQRVAHQHVDDPRAPERGAEHDDPGRLGTDMADPGRPPPQRVLAQGAQGRLGLLRVHNGDEL